MRYSEPLIKLMQNISLSIQGYVLLSGVPTKFLHVVIVTKVNEFSTSYSLLVDFPDIRVNSSVMSSTDKLSVGNNSNKSGENTGRGNGDGIEVMAACEVMPELSCHVDQEDEDESGARLNGKNGVKDGLDVDEASELLAYLHCTCESSRPRREQVYCRKEGFASRENDGELVQEVDLVSDKESRHPLDKYGEIQQLYTSDESISSKEDDGTYEQDVDEARKLWELLINCSCDGGQNGNRDTEVEGSMSDIEKRQQNYVVADCLETAMRNRWQIGWKSRI